MAKTQKNAYILSFSSSIKISYSYFLPNGSIDYFKLTCIRPLRPFEVASCYRFPWSIFLNCYKVGSTCRGMEAFNNASRHTQKKKHFKKNDAMTNRPFYLGKNVINHHRKDLPIPLESTLKHSFA